MRKKGFLHLVFWAIAMFLVLPAMAQSESVVTLSGNAYITSGHTAFIDEDQSAVRNWNDKKTVISFYFRTEKIGDMNIALQAKGNSKIEVSLLGKKKKITLESDELSRIELGTFKVENPGYVRMDVRGVKINEGADFGSIESVLVGGNVGSVVRVTPDFSSHFGRRGPSVHLNYSLPDENIEWFYN